MAFASSSQIGVDLNNASTTQLFALGYKVFGSDDSEWTYALASGSIVTGQFVQLIGGGTAGPLQTANLVYNSVALDIGVAQFTVSAGLYAFFAKRGRNLYALVSGSTIPGGNSWAWGNTGTMVSSLLAAVGNSAAGIFLTTSSNPAVAASTVVVQGLTMVWPRALATAQQS